MTCIESLDERTFLREIKKKKNNMRHLFPFNLWNLLPSTATQVLGVNLTFIQILIICILFLNNHVCIIFIRALIVPKYM